MEHITEALGAAIEFARGRKRPDLDRDRQLAFALTRAVEIAGEAASRISPEFRSAASEVPWPQIIGTRNRLVHAYFDVDLDVLWVAVTVEAPLVLLSVQKLLQQA